MDLVRLESGFCSVLEHLNGPPRQLERLLRLSLVTCPVALYPATSDSEKISFNQINRKTGHRIKYADLVPRRGIRHGRPTILTIPGRVA
jgi:hypothetical protein